PRVGSFFSEALAHGGARPIASARYSADKPNSRNHPEITGSPSTGLAPIRLAMCARGHGTAIAVLPMPNIQSRPSAHTRPPPRAPKLEPRLNQAAYAMPPPAPIAALTAASAGIAGSATPRAS